MHVRQHIRSFETVESHYCRRDSKSFTFLKTLIYLKCTGFIKIIVQIFVLLRLAIYVDVLNLAFNSPIKDKCDLCVSFANAHAEEKENLTEIYENHIKNKELPRKHK